MHPTQLAQFAQQVALTPDGTQRTFRWGPLVLLVSHAGTQWVLRATLTLPEGVTTGVVTIDERTVRRAMKYAYSQLGRVPADLVGDGGEEEIDVVGAVRNATVRAGLRRLAGDDVVGAVTLRRPGKRGTQQNLTFSPGKQLRIVPKRPPRFATARPLTSQPLTGTASNAWRASAGRIRLRYGLPPFPPR